MKKFLLSLAVLVVSAFALGAQEPATLTVAEGGVNTSSTVPLNMMYWDSEGTTTQVIYNASKIEDMEGGTITAIKFYVSGSFTEVPDAVCQLSMGTTTQSVYESATPITGLTVVKPEAVSAESGVTEVEYVFDTPFVYEGGNLVFECLVTTAAGWKSNNFYGVSEGEKISMSRTTTYNFLPTTTFTYTPAPLQEYNATVNVNELDFGKVAKDTEAVMKVTLKNKGTNAFTPAISGLEAPFSTTYEAAELASGETVEIPVTFAPTAFDEYEGTMTINCGEAGTFTVALSGKCVNEYELTVCDGENQGQYAPIYGYYCDTQGTFVQMLYPAEMLSEAAGAKILGVKFYPTGAITVGAPTIELALKGTEETAFEAESAIAVPSNLITDLTTVASLTLTNGQTDLEFEFDEPFTYEGGNLAIQTLVAVKGSWTRTWFYGVNQETNTAYVQWAETGGYNQMAQFLPKMTLIYTKEETPVEPEIEKLYVVGTFNGWSQEDGMIELEANDEGTEFAGSVELEANAEFKVITPAEEEGEWIWFGGQDDNGVGYFEINDDLLEGEIALVDGANFRVTDAGCYEITVKEAAGRGISEPLVMVVTKTPTGISEINTSSVVSVQYVDAMGRVSDRPFNGVNIVVTRHADGTTTTSKIVK
ncbi:MAG: hypothetical protein J6X22_02035 [Muribaculaceae bacterium]|nr:hypothetical protein [Muribaculaceae bacterium]